MEQAVSAKERHKWRGKRSEPFVKREQGRLAGKNIADEHGDKIEKVVVAKARGRNAPAPGSLSGFRYE
jgi:hypothetical protein